MPYRPRPACCVACIARSDPTHRASSCAACGVRYIGVELSARNWMQIWVPVGFLHAYCALTTETEVIYKVTGAYDKAAERGVIWNDPDIGIEWPVPAAKAILSDKDKVLPRLRDLPLLFEM
jgi:dTDP-4-dehydrorhamnose 3,5-epimerase